MSALIAASTAPTIPESFDYMTLPAEVAGDARAAAARIRGRMRDSIIETGRDLLMVKDRLDHGTFGKWLSAEFSMTARSAERYMSAAALVAKNDTVSHLPTKAIYLLAAPSTPPETVADVIAGLKTGNVPTAKAIAEHIQGARDAIRRAEAEAREKARRERGKGARARQAAEQLQRDRFRDKITAELEARLGPLATRIRDALAPDDLRMMLGALAQYEAGNILQRLLRETAP